MSINSFFKKIYSFSKIPITLGLTYYLFNKKYKIFKNNYFQHKIMHSLSIEENDSTNKVNEYFEILNQEELIKKYPNLHILNSKTVDILIGQLRDKTLSMEEFRNIAKRLIRIIIEETFALECTQEVVKESPVGKYKTFINPNKLKDYIAISILRSGNSMTDDLLNLLPEVSIGNVMMQRDENTEEKHPIFFFEKMPKNLNNKKILVMDPMLATGGSAGATIDILIRKGVKPEDIIFVNIISCEEGLTSIFKRFPGIKVITAKVDPVLIKIKYIAPGIGDFGDRYYGTTH